MKFASRQNFYRKLFIYNTINIIAVKQKVSDFDYISFAGAEQ